jgi:hypothetical protein
MSKVVVNLGYRSIVLDAEKALTFISMVQDAEMYQSKYHSSGETGKPSFNTYHIYPMDADNGFTMQMLTNESYNMYKLAGKPDGNY